HPPGTEGAVYSSGVVVAADRAGGYIVHAFAHSARDRAGRRRTGPALVHRRDNGDSARRISRLPSFRPDVALVSAASASAGNGYSLYRLSAGNGGRPDRADYGEPLRPPPGDRADGRAPVAAVRRPGTWTGRSGDH